MLFIFCIALSRGIFVKPDITCAPAKYAGLFKSKPLFFIFSLSHVIVLAPDLSFLNLESIGGEKSNKSYTAFTNLGDFLSFSFAIVNKEFLRADTAAPCIPKPLNNESAMPFAILPVLSCFSSSSSSPKASANKALCSALNAIFCIAA